MDYHGLLTTRWDWFVCVSEVCQEENMNVRYIVDRFESVYPTVAAAPLRKFEGALAYSGPYAPSVQLAVDELAFACALLRQQAFGIFQSPHIALCSEQLGLSLPPPEARKSHAEHMFCAWRVCGCLVWLKPERNVKGFPYIRACLFCETSTYDDSITGEGVRRKRPDTICMALFAVRELHSKSSPLHQKVAEIPNWMLIATKRKGQGNLKDESDHRGVLDVHDAICEDVDTLPMAG